MKVEKRGGKLRAVLVFKREELMYDIKNYCYIESHTMGEEAGHGKHMAADVGEEGNADRATRLLGLLAAQAEEMLYPFSKRPVRVGEELMPWTDEMTEPGCYAIWLELPADFSQTTVNLLEKLIHEWMVCRVVADWLGIAYPAKAEGWVLKAAQAEDQIEKAKNGRGGITLRATYPM